MLTLESNRPTYANYTAKDMESIMRYIRKVYAKPQSKIHYIASTQAVWIESRGTNVKIGYIVESK